MERAQHQGRHSSLCIVGFLLKAEVTRWPGNEVLGRFLYSCEWQWVRLFEVGLSGVVEGSPCACLSVWFCFSLNVVRVEESWDMVSGE